MGAVPRSRSISLPAHGIDRNDAFATQAKSGWSGPTHDRAASGHLTRRRRHPFQPSLWPTQPQVTALQVRSGLARDNPANPSNAACRSSRRVMHAGRGIAHCAFCCSEKGKHAIRGAWPVSRSVSCRARAPPPLSGVSQWRRQPYRTGTLSVRVPAHRQCHARMLKSL
jgi:hypothetical protein